MIRGLVYRQAPDAWFGDVIDDDPEARYSLLEMVTEETYRAALDRTLDALARAYQRRQLFGWHRCAALFCTTKIYGAGVYCSDACEADDRRRRGCDDVVVHLNGADSPCTLEAGHDGDHRYAFEC